MSITNRLLDWWHRLGGSFPETIYYDAVSGQGSQGKTVEMWQTVIDVTPDGSFGPQTDQWTKSWQQAHGIDPDGVVGPLTWTAAMKTVGNATTPKATGGPPPGTRPLPQSIANKAAITAFAIETLNDRSIQMGQTNERAIEGYPIVARIEPHTWTHRNGVLVTGLNPPIRGVTLYVRDDATVSGDVVWRVSEHGCDTMHGEYRTQTDQGGRMAEVGSEGEHGCPSDIRGNPKKYRFKR